MYIKSDKIIVQYPKKIGLIIADSDLTKKLSKFALYFT